MLRDYGTLWKIASSAKKDTGPAARNIDDIVLLLGVDDVALTKRFYVERGLSVTKSFGRKYVEFATAPVRLALYSCRAAAKDAGVSIEGNRLTAAHHQRRRPHPYRPGRVRVGGRLFFCPLNPPPAGQRQRARHRPPLPWLWR